MGFFFCRGFGSRGGERSQRFREGEGIGILCCAIFLVGQSWFLVEVDYANVIGHPGKGSAFSLAVIYVVDVFGLLGRDAESAALGARRSLGAFRCFAVAFSGHGFG